MNYFEYIPYILALYFQINLVKFIISRDPYIFIIHFKVAIFIKEINFVNFSTQFDPFTRFTINFIIDNLKFFALSRLHQNHSINFLTNLYFTLLKIIKIELFKFAIIIILNLIRFVKII